MPSGDSFYEDARRAAVPELVELSSKIQYFMAPRLRISRVAQLDAELLDTELHSILQDPVGRALQDLRHPARPSLEPELLAILRFIVLRLSLSQTGASYGARLQNLRYRDERAYRGPQHSSPIIYAPSTLQFNLYTILAVLPSYLHARSRDYMLSHGWSDYPVPRSTSALFLQTAHAPRSARDNDRRKRERKRWVWEMLLRAERMWAIGRLANFLVFLYDGKYRTLVDRILRLRLTYAKRAVTRNVSFEFLNRQLVWEAFTEFLLFLMPLINLRKLRLRTARFFARYKAAQQLLSVIPAPVRNGLGLPAPTKTKGKGKEQNASARGPYRDLPPEICAICYATSLAPPTRISAAQADPTDPGVSTGILAQQLDRTSRSKEECEVKIPYLAACCHSRYCYYCIAGRMVSAEDEALAWTCLRCGRDCLGANRWAGELVALS